jgi:hypothetical protein
MIRASDVEGAQATSTMTERLASDKICACCVWRSRDRQGARFTLPNVTGETSPYFTALTFVVVVGRINTNLATT